MNWHTFRDSLRLSNEAEIHPHVPQESAESFQSIDTETTEIEYLDLLYGVVRAVKPKAILDTGAHKGYSAIAMGFATRDNSMSGCPSGQVTSVEKSLEYFGQAAEAVRHAGLSNYVKVRHGDTLTILRDEDGARRFDMVYFDSSRACRTAEFQYLLEKGSLVPRSILAFHDTSPLRKPKSERDRNVHSKYLRKVKDTAEICSEKLIFNLSRGLTIYRL